MNVRIFLTTSSLLLIGWMTTSYFSAVPLDGSISQEAQPAELVFASAETSLAEVK